MARKSDCRLLLYCEKVGLQIIALWRQSRTAGYCFIARKSVSCSANQKDREQLLEISDVKYQWLRSVQVSASWRQTRGAELIIKTNNKYVNSHMVETVSSPL
jgi:hypothetical protein